MNATEQVYRTFHDDVRAWFARRVPPDAIDDLVQDTFVRIHRSLPQLQDADRIAPWVFRVCRSVLVDSARRHRPTEDLPEHLLDDTAPPEPDVTGMVAAWLPAMVDALPLTYREAVRLSELEGMSQQEVATRLGLSPSGARSRVQRGRRLLRESLDACCSVQLVAGEVVDVRPQASCGCAPEGPCGTPGGPAQNA